MKDWVSNALIGSMYLAIFMELMFLNTYQHESVHEQIGLQNGATNCTIRVNLFGGETICHWESTNDPIAVQRRIQADMLNSINEIVGYNVQTILVLIVILSFLSVKSNPKEEKKPQSKKQFMPSCFDEWPPNPPSTW